MRGGVRGGVRHRTRGECVSPLPVLVLAVQGGLVCVLTRPCCWLCRVCAALGGRATVGVAAWPSRAAVERAGEQRCRVAAMQPMELGLPSNGGGLAAVASYRDIGLLAGLALIASGFTVHMINVARSHPEILEPSAGQVGCCTCFSFMWLLWVALRLLPAAGARSKVTGPGSRSAGSASMGSNFPMLAAMQATSLEYVDAAAELCVFVCLFASVLSHCARPFHFAPALVYLSSSCLSGQLTRLPGTAAPSWLCSGSATAHLTSSVLRKPTVAISSGFYGAF
eukprot:COSAG02_NODE_96_length_37408_cov_9.762604_1_plen_281_part_00